MRIAVTVAAVIWILVTARPILQPLAVGLLVWLVLGASVRKVQGLVPARFRRGKFTVRVVGAVGVLLVLFLLGLFVGENIAELRANRDLYEANLDRWLARAGELVGAAQPLQVADLIGRIDFTTFVLNVAGSTASYLAALFVVLVYVVFIFVEAEAIDDKIAAFAGDPARERRLRRFLWAVRRGIDDFLGVQVLIGLMQAVPTYLLLAVIGVDAPLFWAVLIFLFSFIPTIGTLVGIAFPAAMTLLQFGTLGPFILVVTVLGGIQVVASNVIQPQLMSRSLNLSPLVVLFAVFAGGALWGIVGALMAVPALTIVAIVCAEEPSLRPVAVALSANGTLPSRADAHPNPLGDDDPMPAVDPAPEDDPPAVPAEGGRRG